MSCFNTKDEIRDKGRDKWNDKRDDVLNQIKESLKTKQSLFITGSAGTGKSSLIRRMKEDDFFDNQHETIYLGPTGVSAYNINGVTLNSFFKLNPFEESLISYIENSIKSVQRKKLNENTILIIDEISMVSNLMLDIIDFVLRKSMQSSKPFGGLKMIFIGDFLQLPPVYKAGECYPEDIDNYYNNHDILDPGKILMTLVKSCYLCNSWKKANPKIIKLETNHRFADSTESQKTFITELQRLRKGIYNYSYWCTYNDNKEKDGTKLTALKAEAQKINEEELSKLKGTIYIINFSIPDNVRDKLNKELLTPIEPYQRVTLKKGAKVVLTKNLDTQNGLVNGSTGKVIDVIYKVISKDDAGNENIESEGESKSESKSESKNNVVVLDATKNEVKLQIDFGGKIRTKIIEPTGYDISIITSEINSKNKQVSKKHVITVKYFPILLAWAITIHKSQGLTLDAVTLIGRSIFAPHQLYVALSRVKNPKNLFIETLPKSIHSIERELLDLYS